MITPEASIAIRFGDVSKEYRLYDKPADRILDQTGLDRWMFWRPRAVHHPFHALKDVDITIGQGERVGIIGRNGAGKTTLLKLITQNFAPTSGTVEVNGTVQALMQLGIGFHPEFSGYENIKAALNYNGLTGKAFKEALDDVIDFVELDEFLHQPMKTYSLGMGARVQFATATAIRPDILIVDEVMGAGDAYFSAKSAHRMERLTSAGCTLLLVSHSISQVLQFCKRGIFLHQGSVRMDGPVLEVVKAYEEFIAELTQAEQNRRFSEGVAETKPNVKQKDYPTPQFQREQMSKLLVENGEQQTSAQAVLSVSRWKAEVGLKLNRVEVFDDEGRSALMVSAGKPCAIEVDITAEVSGEFSFRIAFLIMTMDGVAVIRNLSEQFFVELAAGDIRTVRLHYDNLLLAKGEFVFSAALFKHYDPEDTSTAIRYDLLSRSFKLSVVPVHRTDPSIFNHPVRWELLESTEGQQP